MLIIQSAKVYICKLQSLLITNEIIIIIFTLIETLPIITNSILFSLSLSSYTYPHNIVETLTNISYYDFFRKQFIHNDNEPISYKTKSTTYPFYYPLICLILYLIFIIYKILLKFKFVSKYKIPTMIMINIYEFLFMRIFSIIIFDTLINLMMNNNNNIALLFLNVIIIAVVFFEMYFHFGLCYVYLPLNYKRKTIYTNKLIIKYDQYLLLLKLIISFEHNIPLNLPNASMLKLFLQIGFFIVNSLLCVQKIYLILYNKYVYLDNTINIHIRCVITFSLDLICVYLIVLKCYYSSYFYLGIVNVVIIACVLCFILRKLSIKKMKHNNNTISNLIYLVSESGSKDIKTIMYRMIVKHKFVCDNDDKCKICDCVMFYHKKTKTLISCDKLIVFLYEHVKKNSKEIFEGKYGLECLSFYLIFEIFISYLAKKKNLIQFIYVYNKIKWLKNNYMKGFSGKGEKSRTMLNKLNTNFYINVDVLYYQIIKMLSSSPSENKHSHEHKINPISASIQNYKYLFNIDRLNQSIKQFIDKLLFFIKSNDKTPQELFKLSHSFTYLRNNVDFNYLVSKENKLNYACILYAYIMEELFNDKIGKNVYMTDLIHSLDDLLDYKYNEDNIILALLDLLNSNILIKQCSQKLIHLKGNHFSKIFPNFLSSEGNSKLLKTLTQQENNHFQFYYGCETTKTTEKFTMKFTGLPSLKNMLISFVYMGCNFLIEKENFLIFQRKFNDDPQYKILISFSESMSNYLQITQPELNEYIYNNKYITLFDICEENTNIIDRYNIENYFRFVFKKANYKIENKSKLILILKETINDYEIYCVREQNKPNLEIKTNAIISSVHNQEQETSLTQSINKSKMHFKLQLTQTGFSSSMRSGSVLSAYNRSIKSITNEETSKYKAFFYFTYMLISFNVIILIVFILFIYLQISNNNYLKETYLVITNYREFQRDFYHTALSVFSLTCNADYLEQTECENQFTLFCIEFSLKHGLTEKELINEYFAKEMSYKSDSVINALNKWENQKYLLHSTELQSILDENFQFSIIREVAHELTITNVQLSFEDAIKRFVNTIHIIPTFSDHLTSVIWAITYKDDENIDLTNIIKGKPIKKGTDEPYLTEVQKYYYSIILNFQKYLRRMLNVGDVLFTYYNKKIKETSTEILIFVIAFWILHIIMMILSILFVLRFKTLHMNFFIMIYKKLLNVNFLTYYFNKIEQLCILLDLYKENPNKCLSKLNKIHQKETLRIEEIKKLKKKQKMIVAMISSTDSSENEELNTNDMETIDTKSWSKQNINKTSLSKMYDKTKIKKFLYQIIFIFSLYIVITLILYFVIINSISTLSSLNVYVQYNYDVSNQLYLNLALIQIMSLTNQTQEDLYFYFNKESTLSTNQQSNSNDLFSSSNKYVLNSIENLFIKINEVEKMEKENKYFIRLAHLINLTCESIYTELNDPTLNFVKTNFPTHDYVNLLIAYCDEYSSFQEYENEKMSLKLITYKTSTLLNDFIDRTYQTYAKIANSLKLYQIYADVLMIARPLRRFLHAYLKDIIIDNILNSHNIIMILFLICNFIYESLLFYVIQVHIINNIIHNSKENIIVAQAFECFL